MMLSITNYIASVVETWNMSMENWYNDTDRQNRNTMRNTCSSVTLSATTEKDNRRTCNILRCIKRQITDSPQHTSAFYTSNVPSLSKQYKYEKLFPYKNFINGIL